MGGWAWFGIWAGLSLGAILVFALIGYDLGQRGKRLAVEVTKLQPVVKELGELVDSLPGLAEPVSAIERDLGEVLQTRLDLIKTKKQRREDRQRRLIRHLKDIDPTEKRFK
ncbi:MAG: hypothetical protein RLZZ626_920 [Actinomycetota bacterium]